MKVVYCTIASANYLSRVMTLVESIRRHRKDADVRILLCEHPSVVRQLSDELGETFVAPDEIGCPDWRRMAFIYDVMEFNTAVKPFFLRALLNSDAEGVLYFDPDIELFHDPVALEHLLEEHDSLLTPHNLEPLPEDGKGPSQLHVNRVGQFNLGFVGVRRSPAVQRFLTWWGDRLQRDCVSDVPNGIFVDQSWANLFVSFVPGCHVLSSQAFNFAYWNAPQRRLWREAGAWQTADGPLVFFHYSGITLEDLQSVSRHQNRIRAEPGSPLHDILREYAQTLARSPYRRFAKVPYSFDRFQDGTPIPLALRRRYRGLPASESRWMDNPFGSRLELESFVVLDPEQREVDRLRAREASLLSELDALRVKAASDLEFLRGEAARAKDEVARVKAEAAEAREQLREQLGLLRYRTVDSLNRALKKTGAHAVAKALLVNGKLAARRMEKRF